MSAEFDRGVKAAQEAIAGWHRKQGGQFDKVAEALERDKADLVDRLRARWAAASHRAHATYIERNLKLISGPV